jgi:CRISPR/Cas system CSM-associated protein Csm5 (group 7 of RAMP superfamily)
MTTGNTYISTNFEVSVRILSPVHIGAGNEKNLTKNLDYFLVGNTIYLINQKKLFGLMDNEREFHRAVDLMSADKLDEFKNYVINIKQLDPNLFADKILNLNATKGTRITEIKSLISDGINGTYIPGSSIKGAIANVLFNYLYTGKNLRATESNVYADLMGKFQTSVMRYIRPYDIFLDKTEVSEIKLFNLYFNGTWESGIKNGFQIFAETFSPDAQAKFRISIADGFLNILKKKSLDAFLPKNHADIFKEAPLQFLFNRINVYTRKHLDREIAFFEKYDQADIAPDVLDKLYELRAKTINNERSCVLRLSFGSGFHGITGDWRFDNHLTTVNNPDTKNLVYSPSSRKREPARYKSRRITHDGLPLGFVELILPESAAPIVFEKVSDEKINLNKPEKTQIREEKTEEPQRKTIEKTETQSFKYPDGIKPTAFEDIKDNETVFFAQYISMKGKFATLLPLIKGKTSYAVMELPRGVKLGFQQYVKVKAIERAANGEITKLTFVSL